MGCGAGAAYRPDVLGPEENRLLEFYRGSGRDQFGRTIAEIWSYDDVALEHGHDYIQILFPTDEPSNFHVNAPAFVPALFVTFREDPIIMANLRKSFEVYCRFLGFHFDETTCTCERTVEFDRKAHNWLAHTATQPNHNWFRCSRVLHCLRLLGDEERRDAFYEALEQVYIDGLIPLRFKETLRYWQRSAGFEDKPIPTQEDASPRSPSSPGLRKTPRRRKGGLCMFHNGSGPMTKTASTMTKTMSTMTKTVSSNEPDDPTPRSEP
eukprot:TRINITY_DN45580_c0_g1_i1.p1 TRINITY_DN45580_c0_g1~~TRINITY_DN45580_c0_g1_i1.p1  ORF type:complete len:279 (-),score=34.87 TRINITY_DN45580_c0_g1_i1:127-924(-)